MDDMALYLEVNLFGVLLALGLLLLISKRFQGYNGLSLRYLKSMLLMNGVILLADGGIRALRGNALPSAVMLTQACCMLFFVAQAAFGYCWAGFCRAVGTPKRERERGSALLLGLPGLLFSLMAVLSPWTGWIYTLDPLVNRYARGPFQFAGLLLVYLYLPVGLFFLVRRAGELRGEDRSFYRAMLFFPIPALLGCVVQLLFYGLTTAWLCTLLSLLLLVWNAQSYYNRCTSEEAVAASFMSDDCELYFAGDLDGWTVDQVRVFKPELHYVENAVGESFDRVLHALAEKKTYPADREGMLAFLDRKRLLALYAEGTHSDSLVFRVMRDEQALWRRLTVLLVVLPGAAKVRSYVLLKDIHSEYSEKADLLEKANKDALTGLDRREVTMEQIRKYLDGAGRNGTHALIMMDLDNLKGVNDSLGHQYGDAALKAFADVVRHFFRQEDIVGRVGGDEFFAFVKNINVDSVSGRLRELLQKLEIVYSDNGKRVATSASAGVAIYRGGTGKTLDVLYKEADTALYKSKAIGKNTFTYANELDALAAAPSSALRENELISYNLRSLLNNLANGISIFHRKADETARPMFCNERLLELLGITYEAFFTHMSPENDFGIHPDDLERVGEAFRSALDTRQSIQTIYRLRMHNGAYRWVTVFINAHYLEDGSADLYMIYADAGEASNRRREQRSYYLRGSGESSMPARILLDITHNRCSDNHFSEIPAYPINASGTVDAFLADMARNIGGDGVREAFNRQFSLDALRRDGAAGGSVKEMELPFLLAAQGIHWYRFSVHVTRDRETGNIEAAAVLADINNEVRLGIAVEQMLKNEYELLMQIDVQSGIATVLGANAEGDLSEEAENGCSYQERYDRALERILVPEYRQEAAAALALERVLQELATRETYTCTFPAVKGPGQEGRMCRWHFSYTDETRSTIMLMRLNIAPYLEEGYDPLTGLLDRKGFYQRVKRELDANPDRRYRLLEIDFDGFKLVNEELGYEVGNRLLRQFGADLHRMTGRFGKEGVLGRLGSDIFVSLRPADSASPEDIYLELSAQLRSYPEAYRLALRMGVYEITDPTLDVALMCDCAQLARRSCKGSFSNHVCYYINALRDRQLDEKLLASEMQAALAAGQFEVWFQPQVSHADNGRPIGAEALVRWRHPDRGMISPAVFIPLFEKNGFVYELDKYVWRQVCLYLRRQLDAGGAPLPISVNISRLDLLQEDFQETLEAIVEEQRIPLELLHLEVTESAFTAGTERVAAVFKALAARGFTMAIDDFGSGYSSLSMLRAVPAQILKLDMRFFEDSSESLRNECIIESIIRMAKMLGMAVLAEGVERVEQADFLRSVGCNYIQGYLYARPMPCEAYAAFTEGAHHAPQQADEAGAAAEPADKAAVTRLFRTIISESRDMLLVADYRTRGLLYANRMAERYYGRAYDPMAPMKCYQLRGHSTVCPYCPMAKLEPGDSSRITVQENDTCFELRHTRAEWNGHDAVVVYQKETEKL